LKELDKENNKTWKYVSNKNNTQKLKRIIYDFSYKMLILYEKICKKIE
jgi:cAMP phosphodiesterase